MLKPSSLIAFAILCSLLGFALSWEPISIKDIPRAQPTDQIEVKILTAPLLADKLGPALGFLHLYHMGFGFNNLNSGQKWQAEFDGLPDFIHAVMPEIFISSNNTRELRWSTSGGAIMYLGINDTYWNVQQTRVAVLNGTQHNRFIDEFITTINASRSYYDLFDVFNDFPNGEHYLPSYTCMDFIWESLGFMYSRLGALLDYSQQLKRDYTIFYAKERPQVVSYDDPNHHQNIVNFYELIEGKIKTMPLVQFLLELTNILTGHVYLRLSHTKEYYSVNLHKPFFGWKYVYAPMPGQRWTDTERKLMQLIEEQENAQAAKNAEMMLYHFRERKEN